MNKKTYLNISDPNLPNIDELMNDDIKRKTGRDYIIKLNYNENKFGATPNIKKNIEIISPNFYPEYLDKDLYNALNKISNFDMKNIYFSNGSDAILDCIPKIFGYTKECPNVIIPSLTYARIENTCILEGILIKKNDLLDWRINLDSIIKSIDKYTTIIYLVNPNMPTGTFYNHKEIISFLKKIPNDILVVIDEAYIEFAIGIKESYVNDMDIINEFSNVIITRTFSKIFGLAGFRIGYCFGSEENIKILKKSLPYFPISKYSIKAAIIALNDITYYQDVLEKVNVEKEWLYKQLDLLKLNYIKSFGNFITIDLSKSNINNKEIYSFLLNECGVLIRIIKEFGIRITIGTRFENTILIEGIKKFLCSR